LITRSDALNKQELEALEGVLQREAPGCVRLLGEHQPIGLRRGTQQLGLAALENRSVRLVSGIGNPEAFERTARSAGARIESVHAFPDHHAFTEEELEALRCDAELLVTSKDSVKLDALGVSHLVLEVEFRVTRGDKVLNALLDALPLSTQSNG
jgi:tetraacyldisaccharide-1-P 4'-kinase